VSRISVFKSTRFARCLLAVVEVTWRILYVDWQ
jgi:hypothetical protein